MSLPGAEFFLPTGVVMKNLFIAGLLIFSASLSSAAVWKAENTWDVTWEKKYRDWVLNNWSADYFKQAGPFKDLKLDCADAVYAMRMIFAYTSKLPLVLNDPTGGTKSITQEMTRWDSLPEEQRVRQFLVFLFNTYSTASLPDDSYPAALNRESLNSGSLILTDKKSHHAWTIKSFNEYGIPFLIFGSRPATTVLYTRNEYPTVGFVFPNGLSNTKAGFRNFKTPTDVKVPSLQVAGASEEQYRLAYNGFEKSVQKRMAVLNEDLEAEAKRVLAGACQSLKDRKDIVLKGDELNRSLGSTCMNATQYDDYSTPNRDQRFLDQVVILQRINKDAKENPRALTADTAAKMESLRQGESSAQDPNAFCRVEVAPGLQITMAQVAERLLSKKMSDNPMDSIQKRWGFTLESSEKAKRCPKY